MIRVGLHYDRARHEEWIVVRVRANWAHWLHGLGYVGAHLIGRLAFLEPRGLYLAFHDWANPKLRRFAEAHPSPWVKP